MSDLAARRRAVGRAGEAEAARFLEGRGWRVVGRGFVGRRGELDLVCRQGDRLLVVEVKTRTGTAFGTPGEAVTPRKRRALAAAAAEYRALAEWRGEIRFAVLGLVLDREGRVLSLDLVEDLF